MAWWLSTLVGANAVAQGLDGGDLGGEPPGEPRGSAVTSGVSGSVDPGEFGGIEGGRDESSQTAGSQTRGLLRGGTPGDPTSDRLGPPLGASGTANFQSNPGGSLRGRLNPLAAPDQPGRMTGAGNRESPLRSRLERDRRELQTQEVDPITFARHPKLDLPAGPEPPGPEGGLTLDDAIDLLVRRNLDLLALRYEVPKAEADILTAGLRNNPILFADAQLIPYDRYSDERPGGPLQYDVNLSYPVDVSGKRRARVEVARRARCVTEAQLQDATRTLIDDLYTAFVNVLAARENLRYIRAYLDGMNGILQRAEAEHRQAVEAATRAAGSDREEQARARATATRDAAHAIRDQVTQARFGARRADQLLDRSRRSLAELLGISPSESRSIDLRATLREVRPLPAAPEALVRTALRSRADLIAYRLGVDRARADVRLARANRYSDIYLIYQPYTYQEMEPFKAKSATSWAVGINAALPVYNRNQGNIARAEANARQSEVELAAHEHHVAHEVEEEIADFLMSQEGVLELEREVLPSARLTRDEAYESYRKDPSLAYDYLDKQTNYNEVVQQYRNALIEHRQGMLRLNTAVGVRVLP